MVQPKPTYYALYVAVGIKEQFVAPSALKEERVNILMFEDTQFNDLKYRGMQI